MTEATGLVSLNYFRGRWQMVRLIEDRRHRAFGEFWGEAVFAPDAACPVSGAAADRPAPGALPHGARLRAGLARGDAVVGWSADGAATGAGGPPIAPRRLTCTESGVLRFDGQDFAAGRVTIWHFEPGDAVRVMHDDGRAFHAFSPGRPQTVHLCGDDRYEVAYAFASDDWHSHWRVSGPAKDYEMTTRYVRIGAG
ncbi:MAG: DUF6314 family protein [Thermohalobaculum sp.]|nr:DUF6314 family protein [Thermohalobaculum sp.]